MFNEQQNSSSTGRGSGIKDFMNSNSLVAKFSFILLVIFIFIILLRLSIGLLSYFFSSVNNNPLLIDGMVDAKQLIVIPQDPNVNDSVTIPRSVNGPSGIEFSWSIWIYINDLKYLSGQYRHIFHKGNDGINSTSGLNFPNNAPGMYISPNSNELTIIMNTYDTINEEILIPGIPINKWVNVILRCKNTLLDVYINGTITKSVNLVGVPKQNYGDVYVAMNGGFDGYISDLHYFSYALGTNEISHLSKKGANIKMNSRNKSMTLKYPDYLSLRWYFYGSGDQFNP
jgi:hypothetical protein